jgi:hypothetical protein
MRDLSRLILLRQFSGLLALSHIFLSNDVFVIKALK